MLPSLTIQHLQICRRHGCFRTRRITIHGAGHHGPQLVALLVPRTYLSRTTKPTHLCDPRRDYRYRTRRTYAKWSRWELPPSTRRGLHWKRTSSQVRWHSASQLCRQPSLLPSLHLRDGLHLIFAPNTLRAMIITFSRQRQFKGPNLAFDISVAVLR